MLLFLDVVGPFTPQAVQTNYYTAQTRGSQFVCSAWCVIGPATSQNKH